MKWVLLAVALIAPTAATAKTWADDACYLWVKSKDDKSGYIIGKGDKAVTTCVIAHWPIKNPVAILKCEDGSEPTMELPDDDTMILAGVQYRVPSDSNGVCD